jgi:hypothetical protein
MNRHVRHVFQKLRFCIMTRAKGCPFETKKNITHVRFVCSFSYLLHNQ